MDAEAEPDPGGPAHVAAGLVPDASLRGPAKGPPSGGPPSGGPSL